MKKIIRGVGFLAILTMFGAVVSCTNDENAAATTDVLAAKTDELIVPENEIIRVVDPVVAEGSSNGAALRSSYGSWSKVTKKDLEGLNHYNAVFAQTRFESLNPKDGGNKPVAVSVNDVKMSSSGSGHNASSMFGWVAEKSFEATGSNNAIGGWTQWKACPEVSAQIHSNYRNYTYVIGGMELWKEQKTVTTRVMISRSAGMEVEAEISIPLISKGSVKATVEVGAEAEKVFTTTWWTGFTAPEMPCPAKKSVRFTLMERWRPKNDTWTVPVKFRGTVGADYGNYFWSVSAADYFSEYQSGNRKYTIKVEDRTSHEYWVKAEIVNN